jgi:hypothetical protein
MATELLPPPLVGFLDVLSFLIAMAQADWNRGFASRVWETGRRDRSGAVLIWAAKTPSI